MAKAALISIPAGVASAFALPATLIALINSGVAPAAWRGLLSAYILAAGFIEPVVVATLPWERWFEGSEGPPAGLAVVSACILLSWGVLFSLACFFLLRRRVRNEL